MTPKSLVVPACTLALIAGLGIGPATAASAAPAPAMSKAEKKVLTLTNAARKKAGCKPLKGNRKLALAARRHSKDMALNDYFSHTSKDGSSPWDRIKRTGYRNPGAENIAYGYPSAKAVVSGWMKSPGHRANILNCGLKSLGVGKYRTHWTQDFGWS
ncbi:CAP domain-containing protein [Actinocorallia populi]|uniref:CAP domain-containing protein n=1 Tax=Actinocorallia populi TaxID=2079200 RepID=UPI000D08902E|nr:CAP domain-containing protein [Actinocorallia populi]